jgi:hypothetical protein
MFFLFHKQGHPCYLHFRQDPRSRNRERLKTPPFLGCANKMLLLGLHKPTTDETAHLSTVLYTEASKTRRLFNKRKLSVIMRSTFHISASVTFETNIWTNHWKGFGSLALGLSRGVLPSQHPTFENLADQQAEDTRTKWQTLAASLQQDGWKRLMPEGLQYLAGYCWCFRGYLMLRSITQTLRRFETNKNL